MAKYRRGAYKEKIQEKEKRKKKNGIADCANPSEQLSFFLFQ